jgi:hypothetical protein
MAGDLTGMFNQLNQAITANPLGEVGGGLMDSLSQSFGGAMGAATGRDPMSFQSQGGKELEAQKQLAQLDLTKPEGLEQAAQISQRAGDTVKAMEFLQEAQKLRLQQQAQLDAGQEEIKKNSSQTKAAQLAMQRKDKTAHEAIVGGFLAPEEYIASVLDADEKKAQWEREQAAKDPKDNGYTLSTGQVRFGADNQEVARGPVADPKDLGRVSVFVEREATEAAARARDHGLAAGQAAKLVDDIDAALKAGSGPSGGALATGEEAWRKFVGSPDEVSDIKIQYYRLRNTDAVANLPPGSASDADVKLALQGWPGDNAPLQQIQSFLRGMVKMNAAAYEYETFVTDYISENQTTLGASRAWRDAKAAEEESTITFGALPKD